MEWIRYHEKEKVFELRTENSTYQMQVREYDTLVHLYYGSPVGDTLITDSGITSAAMDGIKIAEAISKKYRNF